MISPFRIPWTDKAPLRVVRHCLGGRSIAEHRHDFIEVFWCESGSAIHRINGSEVPLGPGDVVCIRADDVHGYRQCLGFTMVNVSFPAAPVAELARRTGGRWPWQDGPMPPMRNLGPPAMERLAAWTADLAQPGAGAGE